MKIFTKTWMMAAAICLAGFAQVNAQENLVVNGDFSAWATDKPESWTVYDGTATLVDGTCQIVQTDKTKATLLQYVNGLTAGKKYTLSFEFKVFTKGSKDDAAARLWFRWQRFASTTDKEWLDPINEEELNKMHGPGGDQAYFIDKPGEWQNYSATITAPAKTTTLGYEFRVYNGATVQFKNSKLVEENGTSVDSSTINEAPVAYAANGVVYVSATAGEKIIVSNVAGQTIAVIAAEEGVTTINNLPANQVLLVKAGNKVGKVVVD